MAHAWEADGARRSGVDSSIAWDISTIGMAASSRAIGHSSNMVRISLAESIAGSSSRSGLGGGSVVITAEDARCSKLRTSGGPIR